MPLKMRLARAGSKTVRVGLRTPLMIRSRRPPGESGRSTTSSVAVTGPPPGAAPGQIGRMTDPSARAAAARPSAGEAVIRVRRVRPIIGAPD